MRYTYAISALRHKRARLAGEIEAAERAIVLKRQTLATLDATLRLFHPDADPSHIVSVRPIWRGVYFRHGDRPRLVAVLWIRPDDVVTGHSVRTGLLIT